jgi:hypothetical protein
MNITNRAALLANESSEYRCPFTTSCKVNGGAGVPSGSITDVTAIGTSFRRGEPRSGGILHARTWARQESVRQVSAYLSLGHGKKRGVPVNEGYRLLLVDKDGVLVSEFQLTKNALAQPEAFVAALQEAIESVEEEEP